MDNFFDALLRIVSAVVEELVKGLKFLSGYYMTFALVLVFLAIFLAFLSVIETILSILDFRLPNPSRLGQAARLAVTAIMLVVISLVLAYGIHLLHSLGV